MTNEANSLVIKNICIFKNDGTLMHQIPKDNLPKIVGMDFIDEEYLVVFFQEGSFAMIDPHKGYMKRYNLGERFIGEVIVEAKVVDNSVVFYTHFNSNYKFYYIKNIFSLEYDHFHHSEIKTKPSFFLPISPRSSLSERLECLVTHATSGIHRMIEGKEEMILFNATAATSKFLKDLPDIKEIKLIGTSPSLEIDKQMMAFITKSLSLYVVSSDFKKVLMRKENCLGPDIDPKVLKRPMKLLWCSEDAIVVFHNKQFHIITRDNSYIKTYGSGVKGLLPCQEIDGIKIMSNNKCEILRTLPDFYINIFKLNSTAKSKDLYEAYEEYESRQASYENNILVDKKSLQDAVEQCIEAACFELNVNDQLRLLKAAHFGKTFLNPGNSTFDHNKFPQACELLRVIHAFRTERICRISSTKSKQTISVAIQDTQSSSFRRK